VLVTEFTQTLYSVASNVNISIKFNPDLIKEYRLIGYDNKKNVLAENGNELEGGEVGSGSGNTVLFEITPAKSDSLYNGKLDAAVVSVNYRLPNDTLDRSLNYHCPAVYIPFNQLDKTLQFATSVAMFGLKLRQSKYFPDMDWDAVKNVALSTITPGDYLQAEFLKLVDKSKEIYEKNKKRRRRK
jgi:Ca-activated chloride channel family protein